MKTIIIVTGYSGVGKSTFIRSIAEADPDTVTSYHIAQPFKEMMGVLWGVDVDDRNIRNNHRPNGGETVGELMASAFIKFREWDKNILMPGLQRRVSRFSANDEQDFLLIDGVRTVAEVQQLMKLCTDLHISLQVVEIARIDVIEEKFSHIAPDIYKTLRYLDTLQGFMVPEVLNFFDTEEDWARFVKDYWLAERLQPTLKNIQLTY